MGTAGAQVPELYDRVSTNVFGHPGQGEHRSTQPRYVPPIELVLRGLGITDADLQREQATVSVQFLRFILGELVRQGRFDPAWYAERNPDVEGARLAGEVPSLHEHYCTTGYFEGRLPCELPFDSDWYYSRYDDVSQAFSPADPDALLQHFRSQGWREGRAGTPEHRRDADRWLEAALQP
jgi:hypothetical protein